MSLTFLETLNLRDTSAVPQMKWRRLLPQPLKLAYQVVKRNIRDFRTGELRKLAKPGHAKNAFSFKIELAQAVTKNAWLSNKLHNFKLAAIQVNAVTMQPGQVFSFWKTIGRPTAAKGYKKGRNIVGGNISETFGGGLCQLSGIIYHTSLIAGLTVLERYNHSVDIYANGEPRFTPLGADATVAFGYKDLRVANPNGFAIKFEVSVEGETLVCRLRSEKPMTAVEIEFEVSRRHGLAEVVTSKRTVGGMMQAIGKSVYLQP